MLKIRRLGPRDAAAASRWDAFVQACPQATFFHRAGWQTLLREVFHHQTFFLWAEDAHGIRGVLPLAHVHSVMFGQSLVSLPFAVYGGVAALDDEAAHALEHEAQQLARRLGVEHQEIRNLQRRHADRPLQDQYVSVNVIPRMALQRTEVLRDGASSIYGSDAVAGVVNLITQRARDGGEMSAFASMPFEEGGEQYNISGAFGRTFDRG
ncbi:MAG: hypothetical protein ACK4PH_08210, partial [Aquincola tertiaricarbonis]